MSDKAKACGRAGSRDVRCSTSHHARVSLRIQIAIGKKHAVAAPRAPAAIFSKGNILPGVLFPAGAP